MNKGTKSSLAPRLLRALLLALLLAHLAICLYRIPTKVYGKRLAQIERYRREGPVGYHLAAYKKNPEALVQLVQDLLEDCGPEKVILYRGEVKGYFEKVAALLYPRLLYPAASVAPGTRQVLGRPLARRPAPATDPTAAGTLVLVEGILGFSLELREDG